MGDMSKEYSHKYFDPKKQKEVLITFEIVRDQYIFTPKKKEKKNGIRLLHLHPSIAIEQKISNRKFLVNILEDPSREQIFQKMSRYGAFKEEKQVLKLGSDYSTVRGNELLLFQPPVELKKNVLKIVDQYGGDWITCSYDVHLIKFNSFEQAHNTHKKLMAINGVYSELNISSLGNFAKKIPIPNYSSLGKKDPQLPPNWAHKAIFVEKALTLLENKMGRKKVTIGIFDNGIYSYHPNVSHVIDLCRSYDYLENTSDVTPHYNELHGTWCGAIAAASKDYSGYGIEGVGRGCSLVGYRISAGKDPDYYIDNFKLIRAFHQAALKYKVDVINCSFTLKYNSEILRRVLVRIYNNGGRKKIGTSLVFASGNRGIEIDFPQTLPEVITVGASNQCNMPVIDAPWKSNFGCDVDLSAPGLCIQTVDLPGAKGMNQYKDYKDFHLFGGASAAAPQVAGCIGLMLSKNEKLKPFEIKSIIVGSVTKFDDQNIRDLYGEGVLNVFKAVQNC